jgi:hypothetical protein
MTTEEALIAVWRQALEENLNLVELDGRRYPVRRTQRHRLRQVDFEINGETLRGLEQNPAAKSRWAELAQSGQKVMRFLSGGRYIANVADGNLTMYRKPGAPEKKSSGRAPAGGPA